MKNNNTKELERYTIYLEKGLVKRAMKFIIEQGRKRSGLLNMLLKRWVAEQEAKENKSEVKKT